MDKYLIKSNATAMSTVIKSYVDNKNQILDKSIQILAAAADATGVQMNQEGSSASYVPPTGAKYLTTGATTIVEALGELDTALSGVLKKNYHITLASAIPNAASTDPVNSTYTVSDNGKPSEIYAAMKEGSILTISNQASDRVWACVQAISNGSSYNFVFVGIDEESGASFVLTANDSSSNCDLTYLCDLRGLNLASASSNGIMSAEDKAKLDGLTSVMKYQGSRASFSELPTESNNVGDVYNVVNAYEDNPAGANYAWDGEKWDCLGGIVDLSKHQEKVIVHLPDINFPESENSVSSSTENYPVSSLTIDGMPAETDPFEYIANKMASGNTVVVNAFTNDESGIVVRSSMNEFTVAGDGATLNFLKQGSNFNATAILDVNNIASTEKVGYMSTEDKTRLDSLWNTLGNIVDSETERY